VATAQCIDDKTTNKKQKKTTTSSLQARNTSSWRMASQFHHTDRSLKSTISIGERGKNNKPKQMPPAHKNGHLLAMNGTSGDFKLTEVEVC
jgi:hypothetical protein